MTLRSILNADTFKETTLNLVWLDDKAEWDPQTFLDAAAVLRILADDGRRLAEKTDKAIVEAVDRVMHRFVPAYTGWDDQSLKDFLDGQATFLENIADRKPVDADKLQSAHTFCQLMWATLAHIRNQDVRNGTKVEAAP